MTDQVLTHASQACSFIGSRADDRELDTLGNSKIPVHHVTNVYCETEL